MVLLGLALLAGLVGCGADPDNRPSFATADSTSIDVDSSPGQTVLSGGGEAVDPAESDATGDGSQGAQSSGSNRDEESSPTVRLGSSVLAGKDFVNLAGRKVGVIASTASVAPEGHIVDLLVTAPNVEVVAIFSPEHGFRSDRPSGVEVDDEVDPVTGLPIFSLYGGSYKPSTDVLNGIDVLVYDLQDVGARYYTYIATLGLAMQAAAEAGIEMVVLDRPNPAGGTLLDGATGPAGNVSFVSPYPIPSVYGLTAGELALAMVGEGWLDGLGDLDLTVVPMEGWSRSHRWIDTGLEWTPPSPGMPTAESALVYPAVVLFEATTISYGQGTDNPFGQVGAPGLPVQDLAAELAALGLTDTTFTATTFQPEPSASAPEPRFAGELVPGIQVEATGPGFEPTLVGLHLLAAIQRYSPEPIIDRPAMFDLLAGSDRIRSMLIAGTSPAEVANSWTDDLDRFEQVRAPYLLYP